MLLQMRNVSLWPSFHRRTFAVNSAPTTAKYNIKFGKKPLIVKKLTESSLAETEPAFLSKDLMVGMFTLQHIHESVCV